MYQLNGYPARNRCNKEKVGCKHNVFQTDILSAVRVVLRADGCQVYMSDTTRNQLMPKPCICSGRKVILDQHVEIGCPPTTRNYVCPATFVFLAVVHGAGVTEVDE